DDARQPDRLRAQARHDLRAHHPGEEPGPGERPGPRPPPTAPGAAPAPPGPPPAPSPHDRPSREAPPPLRLFPVRRRPCDPRADGSAWSGRVGPAAAPPGTSSGPATANISEGSGARTLAAARAGGAVARGNGNRGVAVGTALPTDAAPQDQHGGAVGGGAGP